MSGTRIAGPRARAAILAICFVVTVFEGYDLQSVGVAVPMISSELGLRTDQIGIALSATMAGLIAGATSGGWLADRLGSGRVLAVATLIFGLATLATVLATDIWSLSIIRAATGFGIGAALPNVMTLLVETIPADKRAFHGIAIFCGFPLGAMGAAAVLKIFPGIHWHGIFLIGGIPPIVLAPFIWRYMPRTGQPRSEAPTSGAQGSLHVLFGDGRALLTMSIWAAFSTVLLLLYLFLNWLPALVVEQGFDASTGASAAFSFNLGSIIGALVLGYCVDRFGLRWPSMVAFIFLGISITWLGKAQEINIIFLAAAVVGSCVVGAQFILYSISAAYYPPASRGIGSGAAVAFGRLGSIAGPLAVGFLLAGGMSGSEVMSALTPFVVIAGAAVFILSFFKVPE